MYILAGVKSKLLTMQKSLLKSGKVCDLVQASKCIKKLKHDDCKIMFPPLNTSGELQLIVFTDAAHANLSNNSGSMGAHVVFLVDSFGKCCTFSWQANKIKRVVRSTIAAEALSLLEGIEDAVYLRQLLNEIYPCQSNILIDAVVDNKSVIEAVYSTKSVDDKRLRIDISALKEYISGEGDVRTIKWCPGSVQLANCMTKRGAQADQLMNVIKTGSMKVDGWSWS